MRLAAALVGLCLLAAGPARGEGLHLTVPDGVAAAEFSIYGAAEHAGAPVARSGAGEIELPAGRYRLGLGDYPGRGPAFEIGEGETVRISLAGIAITGPEGATARYALHDLSTGELMAPQEVPGSLALPAGAYLLRRDLGHGATLVELEADATTTLAMGALALDPVPGAEALPVYVAAGAGGLVLATADRADRVIALPAGRYRVAADGAVRPAEVEIVAGATVRLPVPLLRLVGAGPPGLALVDADGRVIAELPETSAVIPLVGRSGEIGLRAEGERRGILALSDSAPTVLWRLADGSLPHLDGLPLALDPAGRQALVPGRDARFATVTAAPARAEFRLAEGDDPPRDLGTVDLPRGPAMAVLDLPDDLRPGGAAAIEMAIRLDDGTVLSGRLDEVAVHRRITEPVGDLEIAAVGATTVTLVWRPWPDDRATGVNVYRGAGTSPVNGRRPVAGARFTDIGLSAGRTVDYRVCVVDALGLEGPCADATATTALP